AFQSTYPLRPTRDSPSGVAILERRAVHVREVERDPDVPSSWLPRARALGVQSFAIIPILRDGAPIGAIGVSRGEPGGFTDKQIALLRTFADQAVIAIENVRLFKELQASNRDLTTALADQTATSEILRVISQSPTDVRPVFDAIVRNASRLCSAANAALFRTDGRTIEHPAVYAGPPEPYAEVVRQDYPMPLNRWTQQGQAMLAGSVVYLEDSEAPSTPPLLREVARRLGFRSQVTVPMLRDSQPVGAITVARPQPGRFTDTEVGLLQTFADQAVIAIENVRLFKELEARNRDLTATSEILEIIASSPTDTQPVFDAIARSAVQLCEGLNSYVFLFDGEKYRPVASLNASPKMLGFL